MWLVNGTQSLYTFSVYTIFLILFGEPHFVEEKAFLHKTVFVANCSQSLFQPFPARITVAFSYFYSTQDILYSAHIKVDAIKEKSFQLLFYQIKNRRDMIGHRGPTLAYTKVLISSKAAERWVVFSSRGTMRGCPLFQQWSYVHIEVSSPFSNVTFHVQNRGNFVFKYTCTVERHWDAQVEQTPCMHSKT